MHDLHALFPVVNRFLDLSNGLAGVEMLGTRIRAIHDLVAPIKLEGVI